MGLSHSSRLTIYPFVRDVFYAEPVGEQVTQAAYHGGWIIILHGAEDARNGLQSWDCPFGGGSPEAELWLTGWRSVAIQNSDLQASQQAIGPTITLTACPPDYPDHKAWGDI
jgi:hypothetical protein